MPGGRARTARSRTGRRSARSRRRKWRAPAQPSPPYEGEAGGAREKAVLHCNNKVRLHSAIGYVTPRDGLQGRDREISLERDRKLEAARARRAEARAALTSRHCAASRAGSAACAGVIGCRHSRFPQREKNSVVSVTQAGIATSGAILIRSQKPPQAETDAGDRPSEAEYGGADRPDGVCTRQSGLTRPPAGL